MNHVTEAAKGMYRYQANLNASDDWAEGINLTLYYQTKSPNDWLSNLTNKGAANETDAVIVTITLEKVMGVILVFFLVSMTIFGNVFVLSAVILEKNLRTIPNYFISSLAVADLLVASLVMPLTCVYDVTEKWILGSFMCDVWVSFDVLCCTSSILNLCVIALDRYWVITEPIEYMKKRTPRRAFCMIILAWTVSVLISIAPLFGWRTEADKADVTRCVISQDYAYTIFSTFGAFYIPLTLMLIVYGKIYVAARNRIRGRRYRVEMSSSSITMDSPKTAVTKLTNGQNGLETSDQVITRVRRTKRELTMARERKATRTLGIIIGAFVVCWLPFFLVALIMPFCKTCHIAPTLGRFIAWLGYVNSLLNPVIYTYFNQDFKNAFRKLMRCRYCHNLVH